MNVGDESQIIITIFKNTWDTDVDKQMKFSDWGEFQNFLKGLHNLEQPNKNSAPLISPAYYVPQSSRKNSNVMGWGGIVAVDVDTIAYPDCVDENYEYDLKKVESKILENFGEYAFCCYSTPRCTKKHLKFRIIFPLTEYVIPKDITKFWYAINSYMGGVADKQTKDFARMFYVPGKYPSSDFHFIFSNCSTKFISPQQLISKYPLVIDNSNKGIINNLPQEIKEKFAQFRESKIRNKLFTDVPPVFEGSWKNCKYVNQKIANEYISLNGVGRYGKLYGLMVSIAINAIRDGYPISIEELCSVVKEIDNEKDGYYTTKHRRIDVEAARAIFYAHLTFVET